MSDTIIDYDKLNKYLPMSLRNFCGAVDRMYRQDFKQFIAMYSGMEQLAVFNNKVAAEFASGFTELNYMYLRSGVAPRLMDVVVSKAVGRVWYQTDNEEQTFNTKLDNNYFSDCLYKAMEETAMTGRSIMVLYENQDDEESKIEILSYNLFRHRILYDKKKNVKEAYIYIVSLDTQEAGYEQVVCEHRFYKTKENEQGVKEQVPYQEFIVYNADFRGKNRKEDAAVNKVDFVNQELAAKFPDIEFNKPREMNLPNLGVYDLRYTKMNKKFFDTDIPEAMFTDAVDNGLTIDISITDKEVEKEVGRGQILLPEHERQMGYMDQSMAGGRVLRTISVNYKNPIIQTYPSMSMEDSKPMNVQFDIRTADWNSQIDNDTARLCENVGVGLLDYCPRLLGGQQRTDDEINAMTDITANTVKNFRNLNQAKINQMLTDIATFYNLNVKVSIRWDMAAILNPTKNTQLVKEQLAAGLISRKEAIRRVNPDLTPNEIDELYNDIMAEIGAMATENRFNNF